MIFLEEQLSFLNVLKECRGSYINEFFRWLNFFDSDRYAILLITFVWLGWSKKWGSRIAFVLIADALVNFTAKMMLAMPRPFAFDPDLPLVKTTTVFGCPSGGAEMACLLGALLIYYHRKSIWAWIIGIPYILLIGFSRLFLGVHFPIDVLGGWALALCMLFFFVKTVNYFDNLSKRAPATIVLFIIGITMLAWALDAPSTAVKFMKLGCIVAVGLYLESKRKKKLIEHPLSIGHRMIKGTLGIAGCGLFCMGIDLLPLSKAALSWLTHCANGLWITGVGKRVLHNHFLQRGKSDVSACKENNCLSLEGELAAKTGRKTCDG